MIDNYASHMAYFTYWIAFIIVFGGVFQAYLVHRAKEPILWPSIMFITLFGVYNMYCYITIFYTPIASTENYHYVVDYELPLMRLFMLVNVLSILFGIGVTSFIIWRRRQKLGRWILPCWLMTLVLIGPTCYKTVVWSAIYLVKLGEQVELWEAAHPEDVR